MFPSFTLIISAIFTVYILHSIHTIYKLYNPQECDHKTELCLNPSFTRKDIFTLYLCTSPDEHPLGHKLSCIHQNSHFSLIEDHKLSLSVSLPPQTIRNGSLYLHAVLTTLKNYKEINREVILQSLADTILMRSPKRFKSNGLMAVFDGLRPLLSCVFGICVNLYILHSIHTIYKLYNPEECDHKTELCLNPSFTRKDIFTLYLCTSPDEHPLGHKLSCIHQNSHFSLIEDHKLSLSVSLPPQTIRNGSLYLHAVLTTLKNYKEINREVILHRSTSTATTSLTRYALKETKAFNLLNRQTEDPNEKPSKNKKLTDRPVTHWKPKITLNIISEPLSLSRRALPGEIAHLLKLNEKTEYLPIVYISEVRQRLKELWPVNETNPVMPLEVVYEPTSIGKLRFMIIIESSLKSMAKMGFTESDSDDIKGVFFDTNIYLLLLTIFVTSFHVLFDFLAFKNDIQFWRHRKSMEGLSFSSLLWRCVSQFVITLYLLDNKTSYLVLIPSAIGTVIELWKLKKALKVEIKGFKLSFKGRTEAEKQTDSYDSTFMKYLSLYVLTPLVIGGAVYSILYTQHKSWYSWLIQSAANGVYAFGFLFMFPQLFINYKLKSVAHLPWRAFMYKAFNTFIDDLFAFLITSLPTAHRVAAFRDDVVFVIYLYQRWLYPVDQTRVNEFGEKAEDSEHKKTN
ncbi:unnamed protein product [Oppiella nova]|uniref:Lipid scramblase CLPTM1L n=1 Tax=Oppiella nova TaxID=334625 RepID=A0A7R9M0N2_9ACAR|nr:unnamed protein product [Oppiella nova]CAG2168776.1 unnamed protein product [Oppiella nova]